MLHYYHFHVPLTPVGASIPLKLYLYHNVIQDDRLLGYRSTSSSHKSGDLLMRFQDFPAYVLFDESLVRDREINFEWDKAMSLTLVIVLYTGKKEKGVHFIVKLTNICPYNNIKTCSCTAQMIIAITLFTSEKVKGLPHAILISHIIVSVSFFLSFQSKLIATKERLNGFSP
ncbi:hypothetical protein ACJX0J_026378 [Zea mays]